MDIVRVLVTLVLFFGILGGLVLIHEIGHHFGLSDDDMAAIEAAAE